MQPQIGALTRGPRQGKQFTYMLLDEAQAKYKTQAKLSAEDFDRDTALAELSRRYLTSRGPATAQDFAWWSGLTIGEAKSGFEMVRAEFGSSRSKGRLTGFLTGRTSLVRGRAIRSCICCQSMTNW